MQGTSIHKPMQKYKKIAIVATSATITFALLLTFILNFSAIKYSFEEFVARQIGAKVESIMVSGVERQDPVALFSALGLKKGSSLVGFDITDAKERIEELDWVKEASVVRKLPSTVMLEITEHKAFARLKLNDGQWLIDEKGQLISKSTDEFKDLPLFEGKSAASQASSLMSILKKQPEIAKQLVGALYVSERRWDLKMASGVKIMLPEKEQEHALMLLKVLDERRNVLSMKGGAVDLRLKDRIVLRLDAKVASSVGYL